MIGNFVRFVGRSAIGGVVGYAVVESGRGLVRRGTMRRGAVTATAAALRGQRHLEVGAEAARLGGADIVAEARARNGEQAPAPAAGAPTHDHQH